MKRVIKASTNLNYCKDLAYKACEALGQFQDSLSGDPTLSDFLTEDDVQKLDDAFYILQDYARDA